LGLAIEADGHVLVTDGPFGLAAVLRVDPVRGDRTVVSDVSTGGGPPFSAPRSLVVEADGHLLVADFGLVAVVRVDPRSGARTIVSNATIGQGVPLQFPLALALETDH